MSLSNPAFALLPHFTAAVAHFCVATFCQETAPLATVSFFVRRFLAGTSGVFRFNGRGRGGNAGVPHLWAVLRAVGSRHQPDRYGHFFGIVFSCPSARLFTC